MADEEREIMPPGFYNMDCMAAMKTFPDHFFDLAIVDPPYGDGNAKIGGGALRRLVRQIQKGGIASGNASTVTRTGGTWAREYGKKIIAWDVAPEQSYFDELFRVSRDQIIWGGNYFSLPPTRCFLIWRKLTISESFSMAMAEYAWTSFTGNAKVFEATPQGAAKETRFHPTQKPISLYSWILSNYAKPGMKILDTHVGSASSLIACYRSGLDYWGFEIDPEYYAKANERLQKEKSQITLFEMQKETSMEQIQIQTL